MFGATAEEKKRLEEMQRYRDGVERREDPKKYPENYRKFPGKEPDWLLLRECPKPLQVGIVETICPNPNGAILLSVRRPLRPEQTCLLDWESSPLDVNVLLWSEEVVTAIDAGKVLGKCVVYRVGPGEGKSGQDFILQTIPTFKYCQNYGPLENVVSNLPATSAIAPPPPPSADLSLKRR